MITAKPMSALLLRLPSLGKVYKGWWIVAAGFGALFVTSGSTGFGFSVMIKPMESDLGWNRSTMVGALTVASYVTGILSAPLGPIVDRYGARTLMVISAFIGGLSLCLVAFVIEPWQYYILIGLGVGTARPALSGLGPRTAISNWFIRKRARAFAIFACGTATSGLVVVPILTFIVGTWGWRGAWIFMGVLEWVLVIPLSWFFIRRRPEDVGLLPDGDEPAKRQGATPTSSAVDITPVREAKWTRSQALKTRTFWLLVVSFMLTGFPGGTIFIHMVPYFTDKGLSPAAAANALSTYALGVLAGRAIWGYVVERAGIYRSLVVYASSYGVAIALFVLAPSHAAIYVTVFILGITIGGAQQLQGQVWADYYGREIVGSLTGFSAILHTPLTSAGPLLAAVVYDLTRSYVGTFSVFSVLCLIAGVTLFLAKKPAPPAAVAVPAATAGISP